MVALAISLLIVIAAASFFLNSSKTRETQEANSLLQDNARYATEIITKTIQQSGYQNYVWGSSGSTVRREVSAPADGEPDLRGYNNSAATCNSDSTVCTVFGSNDTTTSTPVNSSDALVVRFQGMGDTSMIDCRGESLPTPTTSGDRAYSVFEVRQPAGASEPELRCIFRSGGTAASPTFGSESIVRGVELFQVMYGVDTNGDSFVDKWLNAKEVADLASPVTLIDKWASVKSVRIGMVLRTPNRVNISTPSNSTVTLSPLGSNFSQNNGDTIVANTQDGRLRRVVTFTVNLRNAL